MHSADLGLIMKKSDYSYAMHYYFMILITIKTMIMEKHIKQSFQKAYLTCTVLPALRCHLRFLAIKPFLLGVKTSGFKRKLCFIESTIVPSYNSIMGAIFEYDKNKA